MVIKAILWNQKNKRIYKVNTIIDIGATGNFILPDIISIFGIDTRIKIIFYKLLIVNKEVINNNKGIVNVKIKRLIIKIFKGHLKFINFNIIIIK